MFPDRGEYGVMTAAGCADSSTDLGGGSELVGGFHVPTGLSRVVLTLAPMQEPCGGSGLSLDFLHDSPETVMARNIAATGYAAVHAP
jgi:hypothetical protein